MSVDLFDWRNTVASEAGPPDPLARLVILTVSLRMKPDRTYAWPSQVTVADQTALSERTVRKYLDKAVESGWLKRSRRGTERAGWVYQYELSLPERPVTHAERPVTHARKTGNSYRRIQPRIQPKNTSAHCTHTERFDEFWQAYPRKVNKKRTQYIWQSRKLNRIADRIIANVRAKARQDPQWQDPQYIPYPSTYLNGERWEDELTGGAGKLSEAEQLLAMAERGELNVARGDGESEEQYVSRLTAANVERIRRGGLVH